MSSCLTVMESSSSSFFMIVSAYFRPGSSLSGATVTHLPCKASEYSDSHGVSVPENPEVAAQFGVSFNLSNTACALSASFSPSQKSICSAFRTRGRL